MSEIPWEALYLNATRDAALLQAKLDYLKTTHPSIHEEIENAYNR